MLLFPRATKNYLRAESSDIVFRCFSDSRPTVLKKTSSVSLNPLKISFSTRRETHRLGLWPEEAPENGGLIKEETYKTSKKKFCPEKHQNNETLADLALKFSKTRRALVLDSANLLSTSALLRTGEFSPTNIVVPNDRRETFDALEKAKRCQAFLGTVGEALREESKRFGVLFLDYNGPLEGAWRDQTSPEEDLVYLFREHKRLLDLKGGVLLAVSLYKKKDEFQGAKLRSLVASLAAHFGVFCVPHHSPGEFDKFVTEFFLLGRAEGGGLGRGTGVLKYVKEQLPESDKW